MGDDLHKGLPAAPQVTAPALAARVLSAPSIGPSLGPSLGPPIIVGDDGVPRVMSPASESRYLGEQGMYLAASSTLTQFNAIIAGLLTAALGLGVPLEAKALVVLALAAHVVAGLLLCWAARPIANADGSPKLTADALLVGSLIAYRRGWRATMLAVSLTAIALAALAWGQIGPQIAALR